MEMNPRSRFGQQPLEVFHESPPGSKAYATLKECRTTSLLYRCRDCSMVHARPKPCDIRICHRCEARRAKKVAARYFGFFSGRCLLGGLRLVTLTYGYVTVTDAPLLKALKQKAGQLLKEAYGACLLTAETTEREGGFYLHFHAVVPRVFVDHGPLQAAWGRHVWIGGKPGARRTAQTSAGAVRYVLKYITKAATLTNEGAKAWLHLFHRVRSVTSRGDYYAIKGDALALVPKPCPSCKSTDTHFCGMSLWDADTLNLSLLRGLSPF